MIAGQSDRHDVAIYWPQRKRDLSTIRRTGRCPSHAVPRKLREGGLVALVDTDGEVLLLFRISRIEEGVSVIGADRKRYDNGCILVARKGTCRKPGPRDPRVLNVNRHGVGAFAYFDASHNRVVYEPGTGKATGDASGQGQHTSFPFPPVRYPLFANNIGKTLSQPERRLIRAYVKWVGDVTMFAHHPLKQTGLFTDLSVPSRWTLFEAKANTARRTLREAVGQLFDYQRHYDRSPRIAVLLPSRPAPNVMGLFEKKRIAVVWRSRGGSFRDSVQGILTTELRNGAR